MSVCTAQKPTSERKKVNRFVWRVNLPEKITTLWPMISLTASSHGSLSSWWLQTSVDRLWCSAISKQERGRAEHNPLSDKGTKKHTRLFLFPTNVREEIKWSRHRGKAPGNSTAQFLFLNRSTSLYFQCLLICLGLRIMLLANINCKLVCMYVCMYVTLSFLFG